MAWTHFFYGSENPTTSKRVLYNILGGALVVCWYGLKTEFVASDWWLRWGTIAAIAISAGAAPHFCRLSWHALGSASEAPTEKWLLYAAAFAMLLIINWITCVRTVADLSTRWTAPERAVETQLQKRREFSRRSCDYQISGPFLRFHPLGYACISAAEFQQLPTQGLMRIQGRQSVFGIHIDRVEPVSAN
jgi:hypothetical protein